MSLFPPPPRLFLVHGWGLGPGMWRPLLALLPEWPSQRADLGFFAPPRRELPPTPFIGVGHSMGFAWLLEQLRRDDEAARRCLALVAIGGFSRFAQGEDFPAGIPLRVLERMRRRLAVEPEALLREFSQRGGLALPIDAPPAPLPGLDRDALDRGLVELATWDHRPFLAAWDRPLLFLAARNDLIVPPPLSEAVLLPGADIRWRDDGGHLLPLTQSRWCAEELRSFLAPWSPSCPS